MTGKPGPERPYRLNVKLTDEERAMLEASAERRGLSTSDYVRQLLREDARRARK
jgi:uncharacterized protein (DUF1778 family)